MEPVRLWEERFAIDHLAGAGGMGKVYRAHDTLTGQPVAVKVLRVEGALERERFAREAGVLADLAHPAIVRFVAHGRAPGGDPFLAIEWLEGEDLGVRLRRAGLTLAETLALGGRVAEGLGAAHRHGVVHRDVKPGNLWLVGGRPGDVKILDFGIARRRAGGEATLTQAGAMIGTPGYMAPEQARGEGTVDERADVFSLGCVLFKCLTGRLPFEGDDVMAVLLKLVLEPPPRLSDLVPQVPAALDHLIARMLAKASADRPTDAEVARELAAIATLASIDAGDGDRTAPASASAPAITASERAVMCVVVARFPERSLRPEDETVVTADASREGSPIALLSDELDALGGELSVLADGSLFVTVPARGAFIDQAARAARSALAVRARHPDAAVAVVAGRGERATRGPFAEARPTPPSSARHEGSVDVSRSAPSSPMGEVLDRGVALLRRAGMGIIRVDEGIAGLIAASFELGGDEVGLTLDAERARETPRTLLGRATPFVGRERELGMLEAVFAEVADEGVARAVIVTAPPGMGKSRLRQELLRRLRSRAAEARGDTVAARAVTGLSEPPPKPAGAGGFELWLGRGDPMRAGAPFGLLAPAIRRAAGVLAGEPLDVRRRKLSARLGRSVRGADRTRVTVFLGELAGVPFPDDASVELRAARQDAVLMGDQLRRAFEDFLAAECTDGPVLLVLDDVHWGDRPSLQFIDAALRNLADRPLLVIAFARPELATLFPGLWAGRPVTEVTLSALSRKASEKLLRQVLGPATPAATVERILKLAGGDAFYLEELVRAVAEGHGDRLPETVLATVEQRLAGLDARERRVLRAASVFGGVFWAGGVQALLGGESALAAGAVREALALLTDGELCDRHPAGAFPDQDEYAFRQTLVREAAYAMLPAADRRLGHRLAGEWLERAGEGDPGAVAEHFERAGEAERAFGAYHRAAAQALEGNDLEGALVWSSRAVACLGDPAARTPGDPALPALGALRLIQSEALRWSDDLAGAEASVAEALRLLPRGSGPWFLAAGDRAGLVARLGRDADLAAVAADLDASWPADPLPQHVLAAARAASSLALRGAYPPADRLLVRIAAAEPTLREPAALARVDQALSTRALAAGDLGVHLARTEAAVTHFTAAGDARNACLSRATLAFAQTLVGRYGAAATQLREALVPAERLGLPGVSAYVKHTLGYAAARLGAFEEALAAEREAIAAFAAIGDHRLEGGARGYLAAILALAGDLEAAEREATVALAALAQVPPVRAWTLATRADIRLRRGDPVGALADAEAAHAVLVDLGGIEEGEALVRLVYGEALAAVGRGEESARALGEARRRLLERAAQIGDEATREGFLHAVPENARTLALAE